MALRRTCVAPVRATQPITAARARAQHDCVDLVARPQRLGCLPTLSYWRQPAVLLAAQPFMLPGSIIAGLTVGTAATLLLPWTLLAQPGVCMAMGAVAAFAALVLVPGLIERWVRAQVKHRRAQVPRAALR